MCVCVYWYSFLNLFGLKSSIEAIRFTYLAQLYHLLLLVVETEAALLKFCIVTYVMESTLILCCYLNGSSLFFPISWWSRTMQNIEPFPILNLQKNILISLEHQCEFPWFCFQDEVMFACPLSTWYIMRCTSESVYLCSQLLTTKLKHLQSHKLFAPWLPPRSPQDRTLCKDTVIYTGIMFSNQHALPWWIPAEIKGL